MFELLFFLLCGHAIADFGIQSQAMAKGKNRHYKPKYVPEGQKYTLCWFYFLTAHALIHGFMVSLILGSTEAVSSIYQYGILYDTWKYGLVAFVLHWIIDFIKCENWTSPHADQFLHF